MRFLRPLLVILGFSVIAMASQPPYLTNDPVTEDNMRDVYNKIKRHRHSTDDMIPLTIGHKVCFTNSAGFIDVDQDLGFDGDNLSVAKNADVAGFLSVDGGFGVGTSTGMAGITLQNYGGSKMEIIYGGSTVSTASWQNSAVFYSTNTTQIKFQTPVGILVSSSSLSSGGACLAGAYSSLPTSGFPEGCFLWNTTDKKMYASTQTVVAAGSWRALW